MKQLMNKFLKIFFLLIITFFSLTSVFSVNENTGDDYEDEYKDTDTKVTIKDPLQKLNRIIFVFNDKTYFWILKPVSTGYSKILPESARVCVNNFFKNIFFPVNFVNNILQGKFKKSETVLLRFVINTTIGFVGFFDPAKNKFNLDLYEEDFGQTLGSYGLGNGIYIVLPFLGPSTIRDSIGLVGDSFLNPMNYLDDYEKYATQALKIVNNVSLNLGNYETLKKSALDPYDSFKNIYLQYRSEKIKS